LWGLTATPSSTDVTPFPTSPLPRVMLCS
jgi:hypothetical protein